MSTADPPPIDADAIERLIAAGRAAHPELAVPAGVHAFVAARARAALAAQDQRARAADLFLAAACTARDPQAIAQLDATLPAIVRPALARLGMPASDDDEIVQRVRVALLAADAGATPAIAGYSGRGDLRAYLRAVAVRIALKRREREAMPSPGDDDPVLAGVPDAGASPELRLLEERCRADLRGAFASALAALEPRARLLLRQHYVDGLSIDVLGRLHGVHRATCARWLEAARADVLRGIRRHLRQALGLTEAELDSMLALVRSRLDLSLSRQLPVA